MADHPTGPSRRDLRRLHETWEHLGRSDPYWAVLTEEDKRGGAWDREDFFATGRNEIAALLEEVGHLLPSRRRALDFGCGVGRLTQALAEHFDSVDGVDVASAMVELAESHDRSGGRCRFHLNRKPDLALFGDGTFDFVYSYITLQHIPPKLARLYMREFVRVLRPGGIAVFQLPVFRASLWERLDRHYRRARRELRRKAPEWVYRTYRRIVAPGEPIPPARPDPEMEMYGMAPNRVVDCMESAGGLLLEVRLWREVGSEQWKSYRYLVQRP